MNEEMTKINESKSLPPQPLTSENLSEHCDKVEDDYIAKAVKAEFAMLIKNPKMLDDFQQS